MARSWLLGAFLALGMALLASSATPAEDPEQGFDVCAGGEVGWVVTGKTDEKAMLAWHFLSRVEDNVTKTDIVCFLAGNLQVMVLDTDKKL